MEHLAIDLGGTESQPCVRSGDGQIVEERLSLGDVAHLSGRPFAGAAPWSRPVAKPSGSPMRRWPWGTRSGSCPRRWSGRSVSAPAG